MAEHRKKIVAFLAAAAFSSIAAVCPAQSTAPEKKQFRESLSGSPHKTPFLAFGALAKDPNSSIAPGNSRSTRELFFKMMVSVLLVVGLGAAAIYASKRLLPKITALSGKKIKVIETVYLGPRKAVHLIKIDNQCLLIGSTNESITKLADITAEYLEPSADLTALSETSRDRPSAYIENN